MPKPKYVKRKDGRYHTSIDTGRIDENGKRIRIDVYGTSLREFEEKIDKIKADLSNGTYIVEKDTTFAEYAKHWLQIYVEDTSLSHNRKQSYRNTVRNHLTVLNSIPIQKIVKSDVQKGYNELSGHPDLQNEYKITVNQIFRCAIDDGLLIRNPAQNITLEKRRKTKRRALTDIEKKYIPLADFTLKEKCFVYLLWYAGLRRQEIICLTKKDVAGNAINVNKAVEFIGEHPNLKDTKTIDGEREIPILSPLEGVLRQYYGECDNLYLFANSDGKIMSRTQYRRFWEGIKVKINDAAGGKSHYEAVKKVKDGKTSYSYKRVFDIDLTEGLTAHTFRHEFATILYYSGVDLLDAIRIFGHSDSKTMTDIYTELRKAESDSATKINSYLEKKYASGK